MSVPMATAALPRELISARGTVILFQMVGDGERLPLLLAELFFFLKGAFCLRLCF